jgi:hypothetical protein
MKRLLWLGAGMAIGALVVRVVARKARAYSPGGIAAAARDSGRNLLDSAREFVHDAREGMREREQELRAAFTEGVAVTDGTLDDDADRGYLDELGGEPGPRPAAPRPEGTTR